MDLPRTNPVGLPEVPASFVMSPRAYPRRVRILAGLLLGAFVAVVSVTTAVSLGAYCLTSDTVDTRALPDAYLRGER
jgi:hypothetical protein